MRMPIGRLSALLLAWACAGGTALAAEALDATPADVKPARSVPSLLHDTLGGVVLNRTITVMGKDFYQYFAATWRTKDTGGHYSVSVHERPTAIRGSEIWVQFGQTRVFHAFLSPARSAVRQVSRQAADLVYERVVELDLQRLLFQSKDLGPEEI